MNPIAWIASLFRPKLPQVRELVRVSWAQAQQILAEHKGWREALDMNKKHFSTTHIWLECSLDECD